MQQGCPRARVEKMARPLGARVVLLAVAFDAFVASFPHPPSPQLRVRLPLLLPAHDAHPLAWPEPSHCLAGARRRC